MVLKMATTIRKIKVHALYMYRKRETTPLSEIALCPAMMHPEFPSGRASRLKNHDASNGNNNGFHAYTYVCAVKSLLRTLPQTEQMSLLIQIHTSIWILLNNGYFE